MRTFKPISAPQLPWIQVAPGTPYFMTETGEPWTPIGQNDAITWPEFISLYQRHNVKKTEEYLAMLAAHGVTVLRLMMEYCHFDNRYFEGPVGHYPPEMVQLWDDLFALCAKHGLRILLTPCDTFFMWIRWNRHPYNQKNGGPCADRTELLLCDGARVAIKNRLKFAAERWGGNGTLFAWDLWNEIHPSFARDSAACFHDFIKDLSDSMRETEMKAHGRTHLQTVSMFGPQIVLHPEIPDAIYRHPSLDFATTHLYEEGSIDNPRNTVDSAVSFGRLVAECLSQLPDNRPYFDSEHGPIHTFKDRKITLPEKFDDEYFRHMQWAHLASGGAGGGMRWPNRHPHSLTAGMRREQCSLAGFLPLIDWVNFERHNITACLHPSRHEIAAFGCGDDQQNVIYLLRNDIIGKDGTLRTDADPLPVTIHLPHLTPGPYQVAQWNTREGRLLSDQEMILGHDRRLGPVNVHTDLALAVREQTT